MFSCSHTMSSVVPETEKAADYQRACARKEAIRPDLQLTSLPSFWVQFDMADSVRAPGRKVSSHTWASRQYLGNSSFWHRHTRTYINSPGFSAFIVSRFVFPPKLLQNYCSEGTSGKVFKNKRFNFSEPRFRRHNYEHFRVFSFLVL